MKATFGVFIRPRYPARLSEPEGRVVTERWKKEEGGKKQKHDVNVEKATLGRREEAFDKVDNDDGRRTKGERKRKGRKSDREERG